MADDQSQRPARTNEPPARARAANPATDPLAELARLIGQTDPFAEFGRDTARRAAPARQPAAAAIEYAPQIAPAAPSAPQADTGDFYAAPTTAPMSAQPEAQPYVMPNFSRQPFGGAPLSTGNDLYQVENDPAAYQAAPDRGYEADPYQQNADDRPDDTYDDVPPSRRRMGIIAIAGVFALAVIGTAGAFGYRAIFGSTGSSAPPPVIRADTAPSKIVPSNAAKDAQSNKQITDRVNDRGQGERLVSREETPVDIKEKTAGVIFPPVQNTSQPPLGSGVVGSEPKRVRTIAITPDQMGVTASAAAAEPPPAGAAPAPTRVTTVPQTRPAPLPPERVANNPPPAAMPEPAPRPAAQPRPPAQTQAAAPSNAPLSLNPNAAPAPRPAAPTRTAATAPTALAPAAATGATGGFAVQVSSQRSEAEAQAAFRALQGKFPDQLGGRQPLIRQVDLGEKGIYYRAMVGPFPNGADATGLCSNLKAAGGSCIVQKN